MYLLDTAILLELRKAKSGRTDPGLASWATGVSRQSLFLSALSLLELENGATQGRQAKGGGMRAWIDDQVMKAFDGRLLPVDAAIVRRRAQMPISDTRNALLAATAAEHGLTLVTRATAAYKGARVKLFNPWGYRAEDADDADEGDWRQAGRTGPLWLKNLFVRA